MIYVIFDPPLRFEQQTSATVKVIFQSNAADMGELELDVDGTWYWWPNKNRWGAMPAYILEAIAAELNRRNCRVEKENV